MSSAKRRKTLICVPKHPQGVLPSGNALFDGQSDRLVRLGLGAFQCLGDELLLVVLEWFDAPQLLALRLVSRAWLAMASMDALWRRLVMARGTLTRWCGELWFDTYVGRARAAAERVAVEGLCCDQLYGGWRAGSRRELDEHWLNRDNIERRDLQTLTIDDFERQFVDANRPVLLTNAADHFPVRKWSSEYLLDAFRGHSVHARGLDMPLATFYAYARDNCDEMPLYVFDHQFGAKNAQLLRDYRVPDLFARERDCLALLDDAERPNFRWLLIGGLRSGSTFHKDPNNTCAWNAVVSGSKKWILFPPDQIPPGVITDAEECDVTVPLSLIEWFDAFYDAARRMRPIECVANAGEMLFVPAGWWHCVLNVEPGVALTQNFVPQSRLLETLSWLERHPSHASGSALSGSAMAAKLREAMREKRPGVLEAMEKARDATLFGGSQTLKGSFKFGFQQ